MRTGIPIFRSSERSELGVQTLVAKCKSPGNSLFDQVGVGQMRKVNTRNAKSNIPVFLAFYGE
jgi:hypothetical protein